MHHATSKRARVPALAAVAALVGVAALSTGAGAEPADLVTVEGTVVVAVVDDFTPDYGPVTFTPDGGVVLPENDNRVMVEVAGGGLLSLTDDQAEGLVSGQSVEVVLDTDGAGSVAEAVEAIAASGTGLVAIEAVESADSALQALQALPSPAGTHTITVLPVHWGALGTTTTQLATMASESANYWAAESGGTMSFTTSVAAPVQITAQECQTDAGLTALYNKALVAHGRTSGYQPGMKEHLVVYFPEACGGWLGMAELGTGRVWINGDPRAEVLAHEIGHNFGLGHANEFECFSGAAKTEATRVPLSDNCWYREYGDTADLMGGAIGSAPGSLNAGLSSTLGLAQSRRATLTMETQALAPLSQHGGIEGFEAWRSGSNALVAGFRPLTGRDVREPSWAGVQVHYLSTDTNGVPLTFLLQMNAPRTTPSLYTMPEGARYTFPGLGATIQVMDVAADHADVRLIPPTRFADVSVNHPFYGDIAWMYFTGITTGWNVGSRLEYRPGQAVSREAMAAFLHRADKLRDPGAPAFTPPAASPFRDVSTGHPFYADIAWMAAEGISTGTVTPSGAYYKPGDPVARDAMAAFLYRAAGEPAFTAPAVSPFVDVSTGHPFYTAIAWMAASGISTGTVTSSGAYFKPADPVSREAMAAFLFRFDKGMTAA